MTSSIAVRPCTTLQEYERCVELQKTIWAYNAIDVVPVDVFVVAAKTGGQVLGAFNGGAQIGFSLAFPALRGKLQYLHSHIAGVLPDYQNRGVGRQIKTRQREDALQRGISLIEWTFDPLELRNAHFNFVRLGAIARRYEANLYGRTSGPLDANLQTDRFYAEWWVSSPRVEASLAGASLQRSPFAQSVSLPADIRHIKETNSKEAEKIQTRIAEEFGHWFSRGYAATAIAIQGQEARYLLEPHTPEK